MHVMNNGTEAASLQTLRDVLSGRRERRPVVDRRQILQGLLGGAAALAIPRLALGQVEIPPARFA